MEPIRIEPVRSHADLHAIAQIERQCFGDPLTLREVRAWYSDHNAHNIVAATEERLLGYALCAMEGRKLHVFSLAVRPHARRCGIGTRLVRSLQERVCRGRRTALVALVRERNVAGQLFFRSCGLRWVTTTRRPWKGLDEDGYVMEWRRMSTNRIKGLFTQKGTVL